MIDLKSCLLNKLSYFEQSEENEWFKNNVKCYALIELIHNYTRISKWKANTWESVKTYVKN